MGRHGGGAFSGKDPSKVDRSAAYMTRYIAKNLVAAGVCKKATIQVGYVIAESDPVSLMIDCHGTERVPVETIEACVRELFDLTPAGMIRQLDLLRPIYRDTAAQGAFGREEGAFVWERTDQVEAIRSALGV